MTEQAAPGPVLQRNAAEVAAAHVGNAVVPGEPLVDEGVVGVQQVEGAATFAKHAGEQQLRLAPEALPQPLAEIGELVLVRLHGGGVAQRQPLPGEVADQGLRARVGEHALDLRLEDRRDAQFPALGHIEQLVVRDAAPEEERQAGRQLQVADPVALPGLDPFRIALDAEQELGTHQQPPERHFDAAIEAAFGAPPVVEHKDPLDVFVGNGPAVGPSRDGRQDLPRARGLLLRGRAGFRTAGEDAVAARRPFDRPGAARFVRPRDRQALDVGLEARIASRTLTGERPQVQLADSLRLRRGLAQEGDADLVRPGGDRRPHLEGLDLRRIETARIVGIGRLADGQQRDPLAVDGDLQVVRLDAQRPVRQNLEDVLGVLGKVVVDDHAAAGAERQPFHAPVLPQIGGDPEGLGRRRRHGRGDGEPADLARGRQIPLHQGRRDAEHAGDVVEAVAGVVGREQVVDADVQGEQIADRVAVLGPAQAMEGLRPAGVRFGRRRGVELAFDPGAEAVVGLPVGTRAGPGRHGAGAQLADHLLPCLGMRRDVADVQRLEREAAGLETVVVAGDTEAVHERLAVDRGAGRLLSGRGGRCDRGDETSHQECEREVRNSRHLWPSSRDESPAAFERRCIRRGLRCSSVEYAQYAPSSRPATRAPRRSRCHAGFHHGLRGEVRRRRQSGRRARIPRKRRESSLV